MQTFDHDTVVPDLNSNLSKKNQVANMFNDIAPKYDFINRFLSVGIDIGWRKKAIAQLKNQNPQLILDVATGTADMALLTHKILNPKEIIGIDISDQMLEVGRKKIAAAGLQKSIKIYTGDSELIEYESNTFEAVTVTFGVRNFEDLRQGLSEIYRVLKPGGKVVILEFSKPKKSLFGALYQFYMNKVTPAVGKVFASNSQAYSYLNESVKAFPEGENFLNILNEIGFTKTYLQKLSLGICTIYCGSK